MWKSAYVGVYQLLKGPLFGNEKIKISTSLQDLILNCVVTRGLYRRHFYFKYFASTGRHKHNKLENFWMILSVTPLNLNPLKTKVRVIYRMWRKKTLLFIQTMSVCVYMILTKSSDYFFKNFSDCCTWGVVWLLWSRSLH